ncbi:MAG TPA: SDR family NAD(P)-dependent oxidoreductase [Rhodothermales bacterium]|nr:SDR family NAD(P)-dependent oxidoreductase [Rhodothermales bacterium]
MNEVLAGKVALVTGAGSGIGRASSLLFAAEGARVGAVDVDSTSGEDTVHHIREAGGEAAFVEADVSKAGSVEHAVKHVVETFGRLDVLFCVVGVSGRRWGDGPAADCTEEAWDRVLEMNLKSAFLCCKYAIPEMRRVGGGAIVTLSSVLALVGGDEDFATHAYAASKGGIVSLTRAIASYYAPHKIRANTICPGLIATNMSRRAQSNATILNRMKSMQPLTGELGKAGDVAHAALYLASDNACFVTGAVLTVDGGWTVH